MADEQVSLNQYNFPGKNYRLLPDSLNNINRKNENEEKIVDAGDPGIYTAGWPLKTLAFGMRHLPAALRISFGKTQNADDISTNAVRFATRGNVLYGTKPDNQREPGSENGALRHALWQASITSEFDADIAKQAGNAHEKNPYANLRIRTFPKLEDADLTADMLNNIIGRRVGTEHKGKNMQEMALLLLDEFKEKGLYTADKNRNGEWEVRKTKLSQEKYESLKDIYNKLNSAAWYPHEAKERELEREMLKKIWKNLFFNKLPMIQWNKKTTE